MALMDTLKQLMKGRSEVVERGIDTAVAQLGRYGDQLKRSAEAAKAQARNLDPERSAPGGTVAVPDTPTPAGPPPTTATPPPTPPPPPPPPATPEGPSLRGDLVDPDDPPVAPPAR
jgi:hypothetical protein